MAMARFKDEIEEAGIAVRHGSLPDVMGDRAQLAELFTSIISNSIRFRGRNAPEIEVAAEREGARWHFSIRDNGIGLDPQHAERIFQIFQRLNPRDQFSGDGIGLAIARRIVEHHGGRIWVEAAGVDQGCTVHFTLPGPAHGE